MIFGLHCNNIVLAPLDILHNPSGVYSPMYPCHAHYIITIHNNPWKNDDQIDSKNRRKTSSLFETKINMNQLLSEVSADDIKKHKHQLIGSNQNKCQLIVTYQNAILKL